ncbi:MAG: methyltransferase [Candidatus Aenigmarchaeota archaeon]|nr:methyltransferase [Candidatus Aenigmarchaeota archaeon]
MFEYKGLKIRFCKDVYEPDDDTFLLLENISAKKTDTVLEIGIGTGIVSLFLAKMAGTVTGVDINPAAVRLTCKNAKLNNITNVKIFESNLFEKIRGVFDIIVFNLPYVPTEETIDETIALAWDGGENGRKVTDRFLKQAIAHIKNNGRIVVVDSSLSKHKNTIDFFEKNGFRAKIIVEKKLFFETLFVIEGKHINRDN